MLGANQTSLQNELAGLSGTSAIPGILTQPGSTALSAQNTSALLPYLPLTAMTSLLDPIAALGGQSSGTGTTQSSVNPLSTILGAGIGGAGILGSLFGSGANGSPSAISNLFNPQTYSDARLKDEIEPVGMLFDGQPVFSFKYIGDSTPRIGLMAQEVEKSVPEAVHHDAAGFKMVDYGVATEHAAQLAA
jgi:hypothetical protein